MRKHWIITVSSLIFAVFLCSGPTFALSNSGTYIGTFSGNDVNLAVVESQVEAFLGYDITLTFYEKVDAPSTGNAKLTLTYEPDNKSGTWTTGDPISIYSVKASDSYALYFVSEIGDTSGTWSTEDIIKNNSNPEMSHLSTWLFGLTVIPVPEPSTFGLAGIGILGMIAISRKRKH